MNEIAKFNVQLVHQGKQYKVGLREANKKDTVKFQVAGRMVTPFEYEPLPTDLKKIFDGLDKNTFTSEKDLMKRLKMEPGVACFSVTKRVYNFSTSCLMKNVKTESKFGRLTKEEIYQSLRSCLFSDFANISNIIRNSKLPDEILFEIAGRIEQVDRNVKLAHAVREASRTFNLETAIGHICDNLTAHCIKEESAAQMAAVLRENFSNGRYESIFDEDDFAQAVTKDLQEVSHNRHVFVMAKPPIAAPKKTDAERINELEKNHFGIDQLSTPKGGVAYIDIRAFENPKELVGQKPVVRDFAMNALKQLVDSKPTSVVIDLRNHGGGSVFMTELFLSHFLEEGLPLTSFEYKEQPSSDDQYSFPLEPLKTWGYDQLPENRRLLDVPIYVLVSHDTFSAGEDFACHLKERGRAMLIGQATGGGADPNKLYDANEFQVAMPFGFARVPYGPSWEGVGVTPNIQVNADEDALFIANQLHLLRSANIDISSANKAYLSATDNPLESHVSVGILWPMGEIITFRLGKDEDYGAHRIGSVTKMFTAFLALKLVNDGVIRLDNTLGEIIKDEDIIKGVFADPVKARKMTLEQLLSHTSGLEFDDKPRIGPDGTEDPNVRLSTLYERFVYQATLDNKYEHKYQTGEGVALYSNLGFDLAAWMLELAYNSDRGDKIPYIPFSQIMRDELFTKVFQLSEESRISPGPSGDGDVIQAGCGDMVSSMPDLLLVAKMLQKGEDNLSSHFGEGWQKNMLKSRGADEKYSYGIGCEANVSSIQFSGLNYEIFEDGVGRDVTAHVAFPLQEDQPGIVAMCDSNALGPLENQIKFRQELRKLAGLPVK